MNRRLQEETERNEALRRSLGAQLTKNKTTEHQKEQALDLQGVMEHKYGMDRPRDVDEQLSHAAFVDPTDLLQALHSTGKPAVVSSRAVSQAFDEYRAFSSSADGALLASQQVARSLRNLQPTAKVLMSCHTPHFLGKADTAAPERHPDDEAIFFETKGS